MGVDNQQANAGAVPHGITQSAAYSLNICKCLHYEAIRYRGDA